MPEGLYEAVLSRLQPGREPTDKDIQNIMSDVEMRGEIQGGGIGYGRDRTFFEAAEEGTAKTWLPDVSAREEKQLDAQLAEKKIALTSFNRRKLKRLHMGLADDRPWEK